MTSTTKVEPLLRVRDLRTWFRVGGAMAKAVDGVSFDVHPDEVLGIVGESGSGKSVTALSITRLVPDPPGLIAGGEAWFHTRLAPGAAARDLLQLPPKELRRIRGREIAMVFQEPMTSLNPVFTIGMQLAEPLRTHERVGRKAALDRSAAMLERVGIPDPRRRLSEYPHQLSGGMRQRVMIAMALILQPELLIADEPTTALDVTTQAQILELMLELKDELVVPGPSAGVDEAAHGSMILITHDLAVVARTCQRVIVMYGGKVQEEAPVVSLFENPGHPYTRGLLASLPGRGGVRSQRLVAIPGNVPALLDMPTGCKFCTRCPEVVDRCHVEEPELHDLGDGRRVRCHLVEAQARPGGTTS